MAEERILLKASILYLIFYTCRFNFFSIMPIVAKDLKLTYESLAFISSTLFIGYALTLIPSGFLADKYGPSIILLSGSIISSLANILIAITGDEFLLRGLMFINGLGQGMGWAPLVKLISLKIDKSRVGLAIGILMSSAMIGPSIAYIVASFIASFLNWRFSLIIPAIIFLMYSFTFRKIKASIHSSKLRIEVVKDLNLWLIGLSYFFFYAVYRGFLVWMPTFAYEKLGLHFLTASLYSSGLSAIGAIIGYAGYYISLKFFNGEMKRVIAYSMLSAIPPCIILAYTGGNALIWLTLLYSILSLPLWLFFIYPPKIFPANAVGTATGVIDTLGYIGNFAGTLILGILYNSSESGREIFPSIILALLAGALTSLFIKEQGTKA